MASKTAVSPGADKRQAPVAPFKAHKHGVRAHGTVSKVGETYGTSKHVNVTIRHGGPKKDGKYSMMDDGHETQVTMPAHLAKRFPHGKKVTVHVMPHRAGGVSEPAGPGVDADDEEGMSAASEDARGASKPGDLIRSAAKKGKKA